MSGVREEMVFELEKAGVQEEKAFEAEKAAFWVVAEAKTERNECLHHGRAIAFWEAATCTFEEGNGSA